MRNFFILIIGLLMISAAAYGQSSEPFFSSKPGRVLVYENLDADGNLRLAGRDDRGL